MTPNNDSPDTASPVEESPRRASDSDPAREIASVIGIDTKVTFRDGTKENVKVYEVGFDLYDRYLAALNDEAACVELFCGKEKGWAARLSAASHNDIMEKGQGLNLPLLQGYLKRRNARTEMISPGMAKKLEEAALQVAREKMEELMASVRPNLSALSPAGST